MESERVKEGVRVFKAPPDGKKCSLLTVLVETACGDLTSTSIHTGIEAEQAEENELPPSSSTKSLSGAYREKGLPLVGMRRGALGTVEVNYGEPGLPRQEREETPLDTMEVN